MKKEQTTIRLEPLLKMQLLELVTKEKHQNLNDCVVKILSNHVFKKHEESKTSTKLENIEDGIETLKTVLNALLEMQK